MPKIARTRCGVEVLDRRPNLQKRERKAYEKKWNIRDASRTSLTFFAIELRVALVLKHRDYARLANLR
jgi:hypothetical protein